MPQPTNPGWPFGYVPTESEWEQAFSAKVDYPAPLWQGGTGGTDAASASGAILLRSTLAADANAVALTSYLTDTTASPITLTLPLAQNTQPGDWITLADGSYSAGTNAVTVAATGDNQIFYQGAGASTQVLSANGYQALVASDGTKWVLFLQDNGALAATKANASAVGISPTASNMGSFTGSILPSGQTVKQLFQSVSDTIAQFFTVMGASLIGWARTAVGAVPLTVAQQLALRVDVTQFGAVGNGIADDTQAFANMINYLNDRSNGVSGGGLGFVPQGHYRIAGVLPYLDTNVGLIGEGTQATLIDFQNGSNDCILIGDSSVPSRGQTITGMYLGQTGKTGGTMIKIRNSFKPKVSRVHTENNFVGIDVGPRCNSITIEDTYVSATQGASPVCLKFVAGASGEDRCDVLSIRNVVLTGEWSDATCLEWDGAAYTLTAQSLRMLRAKYGMVIKNTAGDSSWYPSFLYAQDIEAEGFKQRALWIQAGSGYKITGSELSNLTAGDPSQGAADLSAVQIDPDLTHSYTRSIEISDTRIGGSQREGLVIDGRDVALSNIVFYTTSYAGVGSYPVIRVGGNAQDVQLANITAEEFGGPARSSYAVVLDPGALRVSGVNIDCTYCNTGNIQDNSGNASSIFTNIIRRTGNPSSTHNNVFPAVRYSTSGQTEVRNENESTSGTASAAFVASTGQANVFAQWLVHNGGGTPYAQHKGGTAVTITYDDFDTHTWRTNGGQVKATLTSSRLSMNSPVNLKRYTFATLPASPAEGDLAIITDSSVDVFNAVAVGGGATPVKVCYLGGSWKIA